MASAALTFVVHCPAYWMDHVTVTGEPQALGSWDPINSGMRLSTTSDKYPWWSRVSDSTNGESSASSGTITTATTTTKDLISVMLAVPMHHGARRWFEYKAVRMKGENVEEWEALSNRRASVKGGKSYLLRFAFNDPQVEEYHFVPQYADGRRTGTQKVRAHRIIIAQMHNLEAHLEAWSHKLFREVDKIKLQFKIMPAVYHAINMESISQDLLRCVIVSYKKIVDLNLNFGYCPTLDTKRVSELFTVLRQMPELQKLNFALKWSRINDVGATSIANTVKQMPKLHTLKLSLDTCQVSHEGALALSNSIRTITYLKILSLNLQGNYFQNLSVNNFLVNKIERSRSFHDIEKHIQQFKEDRLAKIWHLEVLTLNLCSTRMNERQLEQLFVNLQQLKHVKYLEIDIRGNRWTSKIIRSLTFGTHLISLRLLLGVELCAYYQSVLMQRIQTLPYLTTIEIHAYPLNMHALIEEHLCKRRLAALHQLHLYRDVIQKNCPLSELLLF